MILPWYFIPLVPVPPKASKATQKPNTEAHVHDIPPSLKIGLTPSRYLILTDEETGVTREDANADAMGWVVSSIICPHWSKQWTSPMLCSSPQRWQPTPWAGSRIPMPSWRMRALTKLHWSSLASRSIAQRCCHPRYLCTKISDLTMAQTIICIGEN